MKNNKKNPYKAESYLVEAIDVQGKVKEKNTYTTRTVAEIYGNLCLKDKKVKLIRINGKLWKTKGNK